MQGPMFTWLAKDHSCFTAGNHCNDQLRANEACVRKVRFNDNKFAV